MDVTEKDLTKTPQVRSVLCTVAMGLPYVVAYYYIVRDSVLDPNHRYIGIVPAGYNLAWELCYALGFFASKKKVTSTLTAVNLVWLLGDVMVVSATTVFSPPPSLPFLLQELLGTTQDPMMINAVLLIAAVGVFLAMFLWVQNDQKFARLLKYHCTVLTISFLRATCTNFSGSRNGDMPSYAKWWVMGSFLAYFALWDRFPEPTTQVRQVYAWVPLLSLAMIAPPITAYLSRKYYVLCPFLSLCLHQWC